MSLLSLKEGDFVVYPAHGVGHFTGREKHDINGETVELLVINFEKDRMTLRLPIEKATKAGLRFLTSRRDMKEALETLTKRVRQKRVMWSRRAQEYETKINSGDLVAIAEVIRDLYRGGGEGEQSYSERQIYHTAMDRLAREVAAIESIDESAAIEKVESILRVA